MPLGMVYELSVPGKSSVFNKNWKILSSHFVHESSASFKPDPPKTQKPWSEEVVLWKESEASGSEFMSYFSHLKAGWVKLFTLGLNSAFEKQKDQ